MLGFETVDLAEMVRDLERVRGTERVKARRENIVWIE